jgi:hypothetical protein
VIAATGQGAFTEAPVDADASLITALRASRPSSTDPPGGFVAG